METTASIMGLYRGYNNIGYILYDALSVLTKSLSGQQCYSAIQIQPLKQLRHDAIKTWLFVDFVLVPAGCTSCKLNIIELAPVGVIRLFSSVWSFAM